MFYAYQGRYRNAQHIMAGELAMMDTSGIKWEGRRALCGYRMSTVAWTLCKPHPERSVCKKCKRAAGLVGMIS